MIKINQPLFHSLKDQEKTTQKELSLICHDILRPLLVVSDPHKLMPATINYNK